MDMLQAKWDEGKFVCVGLDSAPGKMPESCGRSYGRAQTGFNSEIVRATGDLVCAYKPNTAFYEAGGPNGIAGLKSTIEKIRTLAPDVPVILDAKRADIGNTNQGYVELAFDYLGADAVTVHPYLGMEAMRPFLDRADKGVIVLCRTSNPGAGEFQDLPLFEDMEFHFGTHPLYQQVARNVARDWNYNGNCAVVVGATYPGELAEVRKIVGDMPILIPGIGAQGGDLEATVSAGRDSKGQGMIVNSSRGIIFASSGEDFAEAARVETQKLHDAITRCLQAA